MHRGPLLGYNERASSLAKPSLLIRSHYMAIMVTSGETLDSFARSVVADCFAQTAPAKQQVLWQKLEANINDVDHNLDGVLGVAILDLSSGQKFLLHGDDVFPQASSIKMAVLAELYRQAQAGKLKLTDLYTVQAADLVPDSDIMDGLTPGVTRITLRDLATMMIAVSDNSATNVLIDRVGMENVNALMDSLGLAHTRLRRKMMDLKAASEGRENISTPAEMMTLLEDLYRGKVLNKEMTADFFSHAQHSQEQFHSARLAGGLEDCQQAGRTRRRAQRFGRRVRRKSSLRDLRDDHLPAP